MYVYIYMHIYRKRAWLLTHDADECFLHVFEARRYSLYLLYWYKSTDTDALLVQLTQEIVLESAQVLSLLASLAQKYKY